MPRCVAHNLQLEFLGDKSLFLLNLASLSGLLLAVHDSLSRLLLSPKLVSLHDFFGLLWPLLASLSPHCRPSVFPSCIPFWAALGCWCRLASQAFSPFMIGRCWLVSPLPRCLPSLFPFVISLRGCSWLPLPHCLPSFSPFMLVWAALAVDALSPKLVSHMCLVALNAALCQLYHYELFSTSAPESHHHFPKDRTANLGETCHPAGESG